MNTRTTIVVEQINVSIQANQCACDLRNPQGDYCLGNVLTAVKRIIVQVGE